MIVGSHSLLTYNLGLNLQYILVINFSGDLFRSQWEAVTGANIFLFIGVVILVRNRVRLRKYMDELLTSGMSGCWEGWKSGSLPGLQFTAILVRLIEYALW